jgi:hypothetical protein
MTGAGRSWALSETDAPPPINRLDAPGPPRHIVRMNDKADFVMRALAIGIGATLVMDAWSLLLTQLGVPSLNLAMLGRWLGHLPKGQWLPASIAAAPPVRGELKLGWLAHYTIGVTFAALLLYTFGLRWAHAPSLAPALIIGVVTVVAPWFILQPAIGAGIASSKTAAPVRNGLKSLLTHTVYGFGLYFAARVVAVFFPATA